MPRLGFFSREMECLEQRIDDARRNLSNAKKLMSSSDYRGARKELRRVLDAQPQKTEAYVLLAEAFYQDGMYTNVRTTVSIGIDKTRKKELNEFLDKKVKGKYLEGVGLVKGFNYANARKRFRETIELEVGVIEDAETQHGKTLKAQYWIAESYLREGKQSDARVAFRKLLSLPEVKEEKYNHAQIHYKLGLSFLAEEKVEQAHRELRMAVELVPDHNAGTYLPQ